MAGRFMRQWKKVIQISIEETREETEDWFYLDQDRVQLQTYINGA